jgi:drug/metabolite transporter (DMT)-like permease
MYFATFRLLPMAEATVTGFTAPIFAVLISGFILKERVGIFRWAAVTLGLAGVIVIAGPGKSDLPTLGLALGIGNALLIAVTSVQLRDLGRTESPITIVFWYSLFSFPIALIFALPDWQIHSVQVWVMLLVTGIGSLAVQLCVAGSLRYGSVGTVIVMDYTGLAWSTILGWFIFAQLPTPMTWVGGPIIIASSLIIILREQYLAKIGRHSGSLRPDAIES